MAKALLDRVAEKLLIGDGCWEWTGGKTDRGYGLVTRPNGEPGSRLVHRVVYELLVGPIPDGLELDHKVCNNPPCARPDHMEPVTGEVNRARSSLPALNAARGSRTTCPRGHSMDDCYVWSSGKRACRPCKLGRY